MVLRPEYPRLVDENYSVTESAYLGEEASFQASGAANDAAPYMLGRNITGVIWRTYAEAVGGKVVMADITREEIDAKIAAGEARTDTKIARMEGKIDLVLTKIDGVNEGLRGVREDNRSTRANQWVIAFGLAVLIVGIVTLLPVVFDLSGKIRDMIHQEVQQSLPKPPPPAGGAGGAGGAGAVGGGGASG